MGKRIKSGLADRAGRPVNGDLLTEELDAARLASVRSPLTGYPADGLDPARLAGILRAADAGDTLAYLELAEAIEERDAHFLGVLSTRKRAVTQLEILVEPASDDAAATARAEMVRGWLARDELTEELFDILDAVGKGYSFTEIVWDTSSGQWRPARLEWRDPRWFRFDRADGRTPLRLTDHGQEQPLPAFKYIEARIRAKSGIPARSGLARVCAWPWMFKAFTARDWAIFTQNFGMPIRLGKYGPGATKEDRAALMRAVANIAADCAAIVPESMAIEFVEAATGATSLSLYQDRTDWLDRQISKAVLGQTSTTDAIAGGHAVAQEHRQVQEDIERADARQLAAILNRDLIRPWMVLEFGSDAGAPRLKIGRPERKDVAATVAAVAALAPLGLKVGQKQILDLLGLKAAGSGEDTLAPAMPAPADPAASPRQAARSAFSAATPATPGEAIAAQAEAQARRPLADMIEAIRRLVEEAADLNELRARLEALELPQADLNVAMRQAMLLAELTGRAEMLPSPRPER